MLTESLRPTKISMLVGNEGPRLELVKWLRNWKIGTKPVLLEGPPGVGKSTSVYAVASEFGYEVIEFNASDVRTRKRLGEMLGPMIENTQLFGEAKKTLVFLDEVDGLSGRQDYAGMDYILEFIASATVPVALASNSEDDPKLRKIHQKAKVLTFKRIDDDMIFMYLRAISKRVGRELPESAFRQIASAARGDARFALNLFQTMSGDTSPVAYTDKQFYSSEAALEAILGASSFDEAVQKMRDYDAQPLDRIRAIYSAVISSKSLSDDERAESLRIIALADTLYRRITSRQNWRLLRYFDKYLVLASVGKRLKPSDTALPWNIRLAIWNDGRVIKEFLVNLSRYFHVGRNDFASIYLPYLTLILKHEPDKLAFFLEKFNYGDSERRVILKYAARV